MVYLDSYYLLLSCRQQSLSAELLHTIRSKSPRKQERGYTSQALGFNAAASQNVAHCLQFQLKAVYATGISASEPQHPGRAAGVEKLLAYAFTPQHQFLRPAVVVGCKRRKRLGVITQGIQSQEQTLSFKHVVPLFAYFGTSRS